MPRPLVLTLCVVSMIACSCHTHTAAPKHRPARSYSNTASTVDVDRRAADLEKHGYTKDAALKRAKTEAASNAWQEDPASSAEEWAYERARQERSAANDKMEKDLAKLDLK